MDKRKNNGEIQQGQIKNMTEDEKVILKGKNILMIFK